MSYDFVVEDEGDDDVVVSTIWAALVETAVRLVDELLELEDEEDVLLENVDVFEGEAVGEAVLAPDDRVELDFDVEERDELVDSAVLVDEERPPNVTVAAGNATSTVSTSLTVVGTYITGPAPPLCIAVGTTSTVTYIVSFACSTPCSRDAVFVTVTVDADWGCTSMMVIVAAGDFSVTV